jgi:N-acetylglucosaminyldiphosphoundecaprenol N-acetyl-beta-D-mannosaminyltransferase
VGTRHHVLETRGNATADRVRLLDCEIDALDLAGTVERCVEIIEARTPTQQVSINAAKVVALRKDPRLRQIVDTCGLVNADGQSIVWASRIVGKPLPERVAGIDLMHALFARAAHAGYRVYILGARQSVLERAVERIRRDYPQLTLAGFRNGYFDDSESEIVCEEVRRAEPDILFVARTSPWKEYWLAEHGKRLGIPLMMGVGGSIDVIAGATRRAPRWMQHAGLEWFFRLAQEPRRLWRRYLTTNVRFVLLVTRERLRRPTRSAAEAS